MLQLPEFGLDAGNTFQPKLNATLPLGVQAFKVISQSASDFTDNPSIQNGVRKTRTRLETNKHGHLQAGMQETQYPCGSPDRPANSSSNCELLG